ncbi:hypothetical protein BDA99DRAFT_568834 [Phascolomyces articulosus]|uniref:Uncharacterized protein n=1 Tax=Phascolomyces articulosus TaxID=60185 RepID=A0AAD5K8T9_9FUNG|nr:hypothetical protein BDA99DRAFT_568834 [Phascolomyces articulosus]
MIHYIWYYNDSFRKVFQVSPYHYSSSPILHYQIGVDTTPLLLLLVEWTKEHSFGIGSIRITGKSLHISLYYVFGSNDKLLELNAFITRGLYYGLLKNVDKSNKHSLLKGLLDGHVNGLVLHNIEIPNFLHRVRTMQVNNANVVVKMELAEHNVHSEEFDDSHGANVKLEIPVIQEENLL